MSTRDWATLLTPIATLLLGAVAGFLAISRIEATRWQRQQEADTRKWEREQEAEALKWEREERRRLDEQRLEAYVALLVADWRAVDGGERATGHRIAEHHIEEALVAYQRVELLAPRPVREAAFAYVVELQKVRYIEGPHVGAALLPLLAARFKLQTAIRRELHGRLPDDPLPDD